MKKGVALVGGVGLGAALMYFFDPDRGKRRRALIRDKVEAAGNKASEKAEKMGRDIRNRAYGMVAETKARFSHDQVTDDVLVDRVKARLGRLPVQIGDFDIDATQGTVILRGRILADELPRVLRAAKYVRGVRTVENQFRMFHDRSGMGDIPSTPQPAGAQ